ncbi:GUN4 domain-containing protein [Scytonema hofmannii]|uniref:GUN4 domain-containing protein n=1 Tax=Scytonema hofmannii TaxID=34078 RepID=UPI00034CD971|nr:GUN4 domain-containing protein [Scytonema hofmannii]
MPTRQQLKQLQKALITAFPNKSSLERLLYFELEKNLNEITRDSDLQEIAFKLIQTANSQGWLLKLVTAAYNENPGNSTLQMIAIELQTSEILSLEAPPVLSHNITLELNQKQQKILVLAAIPNGLRLDKETREIEEAIKRGVKRDSFEIKIITAVQPRDIRRAIAEEKPSIVHFCGHGLEDGSLLLEDEVGNYKRVLPRGLVSLFKLHANSVKCLLLNTCYSSLAAEAISQCIYYVIGMNQPIRDKAAIVFAQGFYDGLGYDNVNNQQVIQRAYDEGIVAIELENLQMQFIPVLWENGTQKSEPTEEREVSTLSPTLGNQFNRQTNFEEIIENRDDDLSSDCGVAYTKLRNFLKAEQWFEADKETLAVMLKGASREQEGWLSAKSIENFPCIDLRTIDQLWVKYSNRHFGFSVQKRIWESVGQDYGKFGDRVKWREMEEWLLYSKVTFNTTASQRGHLPAQLYFLVSCQEATLLSRSLFSRVKTCEV